MCKRMIADLMELKGRIYVYLENEMAAEEFFAKAAEDGFLFPDGKTPQEKQRDCIIAVNRNRTLNYVGFAGHAAFGSGAAKLGDEPLIRIDWRRFAAGHEDYIYSVSGRCGDTD